jgi:hypothetical protein
MLKFSFEELDISYKSIIRYGDVRLRLLGFDFE